MNLDSAIDDDSVLNPLACAALIDSSADAIEERDALMDAAAVFPKEFSKPVSTDGIKEPN